MIIFDLTCLADDSHRRHFIQDPCFTCYGCNSTYEREKRNTLCWKCGRNPFIWKEDWSAYYDAFDADQPIQQVIQLWNNEISLGMMGVHEIWTDYDESYRDKVESWLDKNLLCFESIDLKMKSSCETGSKEHLFNEWSKDHKNLEFVFSSHGPTIDMFRKRGIFVFDCNQEK